MTIKTRIAKLEKVVKAKITWKEFISLKTWPDYPRALDTLAQALSETTGQETTPAEVEKQLKGLTL